ncbi:putative membrane protein [Candidatus Phytoplasma solani]|uniref:hypothetical protein n=1 Tax=Candidatus Phytoplasma solani TaxID=69896 RepID=UPI0032DB2AE4
MSVKQRKNFQKKVFIIVIFCLVIAIFINSFFPYQTKHQIFGVQPDEEYIQQQKDCQKKQAYTCYLEDEIRKCPTKIFQPFFNTNEFQNYFKKITKSLNERENIEEVQNNSEIVIQFNNFKVFEGQEKEITLFNDFMANIILEFIDYHKSILNSYQQNLNKLGDLEKLVKEKEELQKKIENIKKTIQDLKQLKKLQTHLQPDNFNLKEEYLYFVCDKMFELYQNEQYDTPRKEANLKRTQSFSHLKESTNLQFQIEYLRIFQKTLKEIRVIQKELSKKLSYFKYLFHSPEELKELSEGNDASLSSKLQTKLKELNSFSNSQNENSINRLIEKFIEKRLEDFKNESTTSPELKEAINQNDEFVKNAKIFLTNEIWQNQGNDYSSSINFNNLQLELPNNYSGFNLGKLEIIKSITKINNSLLDGSENHNHSLNFLYCNNFYNLKRNHESIINNLNDIYNELYKSWMKRRYLLKEEDKNEFTKSINLQNKVVGNLLELAINEFKTNYKNKIEDLNNYLNSLNKDLEEQTKDIEAIYKDQSNNLREVFLQKEQDVKDKLTKGIEELKNTFINLPLEELTKVYPEDLKKLYEKITNALTKINKASQNPQAEKNFFSQFVDNYFKKILHFQHVYKTKNTYLNKYNKDLKTVKENILKLREEKIKQLIQQLDNPSLTPNKKEQEQEQIKQIIESINPQENTSQTTTYSYQNVNWMKECLTKYKDILNNQFQKFEITELTSEEKSYLDEVVKQINIEIKKVFLDCQKAENIKNSSQEKLKNLSEYVVEKINIVTFFQLSDSTTTSTTDSQQTFNQGKDAFSLLNEAHEKIIPNKEELNNFIKLESNLNFIQEIKNLETTNKTVKEKEEKIVLKHQEIKKAENKVNELTQEIQTLKEITIPFYEKEKAVEEQKEKDAKTAKDNLAGEIKTLKETTIPNKEIQRAAEEQKEKDAKTAKDNLAGKIKTLKETTIPNKETQRAAEEQKETEARTALRNIISEQQRNANNFQTNKQNFINQNKSNSDSRINDFFEKLI